MHPLLNIAVSAARKAGDIIVRHLDRVDRLTVQAKEHNDFVSQVDRLAEDEIIYTIRKAHPDHAILAEESGAHSGNDEFQWIIDPLDGTTNFLHGLPYFAISIAAERDGEIIAGLVYEPVRDEMYWAEKGAGAYVNDRRLRVSARRRLADALFASGMPPAAREALPAQLAALAAVREASAGVRRLGSAALDLAYVAAGRLDGFWAFGLSPWDIAAGLLLVREAGGYVSDLSGGPEMMEKGEILAANDHLHLPLGALLKEPLRADPVRLSPARRMR